MRSAPDWTAARFNLGLAYFNLHGKRRAQQNLTAARDTFLDVLDSDIPMVYITQVNGPQALSLLFAGSGD